MPSHSHGVSDPGHSHSGGDYGHSHTYNEMQSSSPGAIQAGGGYTYYGGNTATSYANIYINGSTTGVSVSANGSGGTHTHTLDLAVQYVDIIFASKN